MGAGPQAVGLLNDLLAPRLGAQAIRGSLVAVLSTSLAGAALLAGAARRLPGDLVRARGVAAPLPASA
jgi:hypothetical protein